MTWLLLTAVLALPAAERPASSPSPPSGKSCAAPGAPAKGPDASAYILFLPRVLLWPFRVAVRLVAEPVAATAAWVEKSGMGRAVARGIRAPAGGFALPFFGWESHRRPVVGLDLSLPAIHPHCRRCAVSAAAFVGGREVWGTTSTFGVTARKGLAFLAGLDLAHRDDEWFNLPEKGPHLFYNHQLTAFGGLTLRPSKTLVARAAGGFHRVRWGLKKGAFHHLSLTADPFRPQRFEGPFDLLECALAEIYVGVGRANLAARKGSSDRIRALSGGGFSTLARWYQSGGTNHIATGELRVETWWTFPLGIASDGRLTLWGFLWYVHETGRIHLPVTGLPRWGGVEGARGVRFGFLSGHSILFGSLEYRMLLHRKVRGLAFFDFGNAGGKRFRQWEFDASMLSGGGRVTFILTGPWALFIQAGVSARADVQVALGLGRHG